MKFCSKLAVVLIISVNIFTINLISQDLPYDEDFLKSLPDTVREDVENELESSQKENESYNYRRPSSELTRFETADRIVFSITVAAFSGEKCK